MSPGMVRVARLRHPHLRFEVGTFARLPAGDGEWAGAVVPYSIIHLDPDGRRAAFAELARVVAAERLAAGVVPRVATRNPDRGRAAG